MSKLLMDFVFAEEMEGRLHTPELKRWKCLLECLLKCLMFENIVQCLCLPKWKAGLIFLG